MLIVHGKAFEKLGNKGWNWETLKRYYTKAEKFLVPEVKDDTVKFDVREHGLEGTLYSLHIYISTNFSQVLWRWDMLHCCPATKSR